MAYTNMERYFNHEKLVLTGNPIRKDILNFKIVNEFKYKSDKIIFNIDDDLELNYHILDLLYFSNSQTRVINPKKDDLPKKYAK